MKNPGAADIFSKKGNSGEKKKREGIVGEVLETKEGDNFKDRALIIQQ